MFNDLKSIFASDLCAAPGTGPGCAVGEVQVGVGAAAAEVHHKVVPHQAQKVCPPRFTPESILLIWLEFQ